MRLAESGFSLIKDFDTDPVYLQADRDSLEQILLNLIDNAIKYAPQGKELRIELRRTSDLLTLCVIDRGPGIPVAQQQQIFDKFHRLDSSLTSSQPGAGLGLSIARQLARGMGGELSSDTPDSGGSCFCLKLPIGKEVL